MIKSSQVHTAELPQTSDFSLELTRKIDQLSARCNFLENSKEHLKQEYEDAANELELQTKTKSDLESEIIKLTQQLADSRNEIETIAENKIKTLKRKK